MNGIEDLVAPNWDVGDLERVVREAIPQGTAFRASSRDPATIAALNPWLIAAGYSSETRVAMVQVSIPPRRALVAGETSKSPFPLAGEPLSLGSRDFPRGQGRGGGYTIVPVQSERDWPVFEALIHADTTEHGWTDSMTAQLIALYRWRAANTPHRHYLAADGEQTVGHVGLFQHGVTAYLHGLYTHPTARRRGAGAALTLAMSAAGRALGCERLTLQCTRDSSLPAYYERLGFRAVGEKQIWTRPIPG